MRLTEKRFTFKRINEEHISANIYDNGTFIASIGIGEELIVELLNSLNDENEQLKSELSRYEEVNRLDIWKSSYSSEDALITELQMKCDKKQEHIVVLENKIRRMRGAIHKLEWLASHRNANLIRENEELKQQIKHSQKRTAIISGWLHDEGNLTLDKYEEILDYCYQEYKKGD